MKENLKFVPCWKRLVLVHLVIFLFSFNLTVVPGFAQSSKAKTNAVKKVKTDDVRPEVLVMFEGMDHEWDGRIILHRAVEGQRKTEMVTTYRRGTTSSFCGAWF